jgi:hypothetical protein
LGTSSSPKNEKSDEEERKAFAAQIYSRAFESDEDDEEAKKLREKIYDELGADHYTFIAEQFARKNHPELFEEEK